MSGHLLDQYKRDSTVRIGKWRWPPPKELMEQGPDGAGADETAEGFLEFKMRKLQERKRSSQGQETGDQKTTSPGKKKKDTDGDDKDDFDTSGEIQGL